jgi:cellulose synthase operon protein C
MPRFIFNRSVAGSGYSLLPALVLVLLLAGCDSVEERVAEHYERGGELLESNEPERAILEFRSALQLDPEHAPSHFAIGEILEQRGDLREALGRFRKVVDLDPTHVDARLKLARLALLSGAADEADRQISELLRLDPNRADVQVVRASLLLHRNDAEGAREAIDLALALDPDSLDAALVEAGYLMRTGSPDAALARIDAALAGNGTNLPLHLAKLQILENTGDQAGIGSQLGAMVEAFPDDVRFRQTRAQWAMQSGDLATAEADLRALVEAAPGDAEAVTNLIRFLRRHRGDEPARAELARLAAEPQALPELPLLLARFDIETGNETAAADQLRALVERGGENANKARLMLAELMLAKGSEAEAAELVDTVLARDPANVEAIVLKVSRLIREQRLDEAIHEARKGLDEAPEDVRLLLLAGRAHEMSGDLGLANDRLAKAVRADGYRPATVETYVQFLLRVDRLTAAETVLAEAVASNPDEAGLHALLGFLRARMKNWSGAEESARALDRLDPERARQLRAALLIGQERFDEGIGLLQDLPEEEGPRAASVAAIVQGHVRAGDIGKAERFLDELLAEDPRNVQALGIRGNLYAVAGELDAAEEKYRAILEIDPGHGGAHSALSRLFAFRGDAEGSERQLLTGLDASPDDLVLLTRLAYLREAQGRFDEAIDTYERLYRMVPESLVIANNLASLLSDHRADDADALDRAYRIAGRLRPSDVPQYRDTYGWTRYLKGDYDEALERIAPVAEALPENPWVQYHLGMVHAALGKVAEAREALQAALDKSAGTPFPPADEIRVKLQSLEGM